MMKRIVNLYFLALMIAIFFVSCEKQCHNKWKDKDIPPPFRDRLQYLQGD